MSCNNPDTPFKARSKKRRAMRPSNDGAADADAVAEHETGEHGMLPSYDNLSHLGTGSFSEVFKVRDSASRQTFALKRARKETKTEVTVNEALGEVEILERLREICRRAADPNGDGDADDEKEAMSKVNIAQFVRHWFDSHGRLFQILEFCERGTLRQIIDDNAELTPLQTLQCIRQIARGLEIVHSAHIIHLDLKPENVLVTEKGVLKICDFGISIDTEKVQETHKFANSGDPTYIAPEILQSLDHTLNDDINAKTDIFSLGVMALEMHCAVKMNELKSKSARLEALRRGVVDFEGIIADGVSGIGAKRRGKREHAVVADIEALIRKMVCAESQRRPNATEVILEIDRLIDEHALSAEMDGLRALFPAPTTTTTATIPRPSTPPPSGLTRTRAMSLSAAAFATPAVSSRTRSAFEFTTPATAPAMTRRSAPPTQRVDVSVFAAERFLNFSDLQSLWRRAQTSRYRAPIHRSPEMFPTTPSTRNRPTSAQTPMSPSPMFTNGAFASPSPSPPKRSHNRRDFVAHSNSNSNSNSHQTPARPRRLNRMLDFATPHRSDGTNPQTLDFSATPNAKSKSNGDDRTPRQPSAFETPLRGGRRGDDRPFAFSPSSESPLRTPAHSRINRTLSFLTPNSKASNSSRDSATPPSNANSNSNTPQTQSNDPSFLTALAVDEAQRKRDCDSFIGRALSEFEEIDEEKECEFEESAQNNLLSSLTDQHIREGTPEIEHSEDSDGDDAAMSVNFDEDENENENENRNSHETAPPSNWLAPPEISSFSTPGEFFCALGDIVTDTENQQNIVAPEVYVRARNGDLRARIKILRAMKANQRSILCNGDEEAMNALLWDEVQALRRKIEAKNGGDATNIYDSLIVTVQSDFAASFETPPRIPRRRPQLTRSEDRRCFETPTAAPRPDPNTAQSTDRARRDGAKLYRQLMEAEVEHDKAQTERDRERRRNAMGNSNSNSNSNGNGQRNGDGNNF